MIIFQTRNVTSHREGSVNTKKCHMLFEWPLKAQFTHNIFAHNIEH